MGAVKENHYHHSLGYTIVIVTTSFPPFSNSSLNPRHAYSKFQVKSPPWPIQVGPERVYQQSSICWILIRVCHKSCGNINHPVTLYQCVSWCWCILEKDLIGRLPRFEVALGVMHSCSLLAVEGSRVLRRIFAYCRYTRPLNGKDNWKLSTDWP